MSRDYYSSSLAAVAAALAAATAALATGEIDFRVAQSSLDWNDHYGYKVNRHGKEQGHNLTSLSTKKCYCYFANKTRIKSSQLTHRRRVAYTPI